MGFDAAAVPPFDGALAASDDDTGACTALGCSFVHRAQQAGPRQQNIRRSAAWCKQKPTMLMETYSLQSKMRCRWSIKCNHLCAECNSHEC